MNVIHYSNNLNEVVPRIINMKRMMLQESDNVRFYEERLRE